MPDKLSDEILNELMRTKGKTLFHREGQELEFKEQFNLSGLADYFRDFAAFANNKGGYIIFGVKNNPRIPSGLTESSIEQFEKIDPERISGYILETFSTNILWEQTSHQIKGKTFGIFYVYEATVKPIIAKKDEGKDNLIKNGEIYYRYGGRTQKIQYAELENIISKRIEANNKSWIDLVEKIGKSGPNSAAILDVEKGTIEKKHQILVVDKDLVEQMNIIKEGEFNEKKGTKTLKLVGQISPTNVVEVVKKVKENLVRDYPLSAKEFINEVKDKVPGAKETHVFNALKENNIRGNRDYSAYNFRNKRQEDQYEKAGVVPKGTPCIYNKKAVDFVSELVKNEMDHSHMNESQ